MCVYIFKSMKVLNIINKVTRKEEIWKNSVLKTMKKVCIIKFIRAFNYIVWKSKVY